MLFSKIRISAIVIVTLSLIGCSRDNAGNGYHPYGVKHAALHFEYFGDVRGTADIFFDNFGDRETHITHSEMILEKSFRPAISYAVRIKGTVTVVDSFRYEAVRFIDSTSDSLFHLSAWNVPSPEEQFASFHKDRAFVLRGDTMLTIEGATIKAHVWQQAKTPTYLFEYKGLVVGNFAIINGHVNELRLMSIDTVDAIDSSRFIPPSGFPIRDLTKKQPNS